MPGRAKLALIHSVAAGSEPVSWSGTMRILVIYLVISQSSSAPVDSRHTGTLPGDYCHLSLNYNNEFCQDNGTAGEAWVTGIETRSDFI